MPINASIIVQAGVSHLPLNRSTVTAATPAVGKLARMERVSDPPQTKIQAEIETGIGTSIRKDVATGRGSVSSHQLWSSTEFEEDGHLMSHAKKDLSHLDYQAQPSDSNYVTGLGSHAYSKGSLQLGREYHIQKPYCTPSSCSWERSSLDAESSSPDSFRHVVEKMRTKTSTLSARPDLAPYPTAAPDMRKYPAAINFDFESDDSEHHYQRSDRFTGFSSHNGQSVEHHSEMVNYASGHHYIDNEITPISTIRCFDDGCPSLSRGLQYGDEIPSLSRKKYNEAPRGLQYGEVIPSLSRKKYNGAPPRSSMWHYGSETTSLSRRHDYGDEIPSLSRNWCYQDKILSRTGHWCHDPDARPMSRYQQGASHGNGHSRHNFARTNTNEEVKLAATKHTFTKPRIINRVVSSSYDYRINIKDKPRRNSEAIMDQVCGPRANKLNDTSESSAKKAILSPLVRRDQFNKLDFSIQYEHAKFFMIKSYSEDDIHKGIKYNVWASTPNGNNKLDVAFHEAQVLMKEKGKSCPVFLFFSVNTSGQFVGLAEMLGPVDFKKTMDFWKEDKWNGFFPITWHIIKDIPNRLFKHIVLGNNNNRIVTFSRDTQEIGLPQGLEMLRIFKGYCPGTSILDDFDFYEEKDNARHVQKRGNSESTRQSGFSDDYRLMENLEASVENWSLDEVWD